MDIDWAAAVSRTLFITMKTHRTYIVANTITAARHALQLCFLLTAGLLLSACKQEVKTTLGGDLAGAYALVSVNGKNLPASVSHDGTALQVRSGTFTLKADGTCSTTTIFVPPSGQEATREVSATYIMDGSKLTMRWKGAGTTIGTIEGKTFTMDNEGMVFIYRK